MGACEAEAAVATRDALTVESFDQQHVKWSNSFEAGVADIETGAARERERCVLGAWHIEGIALFRKLAEPEAIMILDCCLGSRASQACVDLFEQYPRDAAAFLKCFGRLDQLR